MRARGKETPAELGRPERPGQVAAGWAIVAALFLLLGLV